MKFELCWEYISHYFICVLILGGCGMLLPATGIIVYGGQAIVSTFDVPFFGFHRAEVTVVYGMIFFLALNLVTKAWMIESILMEWIKLNRIHADAINRLKFGTPNFRRVVPQ